MISIKNNSKTITVKHLITTKIGDNFLSWWNRSRYWHPAWVSRSLPATHSQVAGFPTIKNATHSRNHHPMSPEPSQRIDTIISFLSISISTSDKAQQRAGSVFDALFCMANAAFNQPNTTHVTTGDLCAYVSICNIYTTIFAILARNKFLKHNNNSYTDHHQLSLSQTRGLCEFRLCTLDADCSMKTTTTTIRQWAGSEQTNKVTPTQNNARETSLQNNANECLPVEWQYTQRW